MPPEEVNYSILHTVLNRWKKQSYIYVWDFEGGSYKDACDISERMDVAQQFCEGVTPNKIANRRSYSNRASHGRKINRVKSGLPTNSKKNFAGKSKKNYAGHPSKRPTGDKT